MRQIDSEVVWNEFHARLLSYVRPRVASMDDAEDLLQEVFARVQSSAHRDTEVQSVSGWVYRITRNAITDYYRARAKEIGALSELARTASVDEGLGSASDGTDGAEPSAALARCLTPFVEQLPERYRQAVALTDLGGLSQGEAARQMGLSLSGVKSRVQRGRAKLGASLVKCCQIELDGRRRVVDFKPLECDDTACGCSGADASTNDGGDDGGALSS